MTATSKKSPEASGEREFTHKMNPNFLRMLGLCQTCVARHSVDSSLPLCNECQTSISKIQFVRQVMLAGEPVMLPESDDETAELVPGIAYTLDEAGVDRLRKIVADLESSSE